MPIIKPWQARTCGTQRDGTAGQWIGVLAVSVCFFAATRTQAIPMTDQELSQTHSRRAVAPERHRTFTEPLLPLGQPAIEETRQLSAAVDRYSSAANVEALSPILEFLRRNPSSAWRASLLANLGNLYRHSGYLNRALDTSREAWEISRQSAEPNARAIADTALATYIELLAALGRTDELAAILGEVSSRQLSGHAAEVASSARSGLWLMRNDPGGSFRCGPLALERISETLRPGRALDPRLLAYPSSDQGTSLEELHGLAQETGLGLRAIRRSAGSKVPIPSVVHWKAGHFAALVGQTGNQFLIKDLTFGDDHWVSLRAIEEESSGYMLVAAKDFPKVGWRPVSPLEASSVRGKGATGNTNPGATSPTDPKKPHPAGDCAPTGMGMPSYDFHVATVSLNVTDTPVGYQAPLGPAVALGLTYNSREDFQPVTFTFTNLGPRWNFDWLSYVEDPDPSLSYTQAASIRLAERGGGSFILGRTAGAPSTYYGPNVTGHHETVERVLQGVSTAYFVRKYPDGSQDVYARSDGAATMRKYFLTSVSDPAGNKVKLTYDSAAPRLLYIDDAIGQRTTLTYGLAESAYKVTAVMDPFGRSATFSYANGMLQSITDAIGMTSSFAYGPTAANPLLPVDFMNLMTTPYGPTAFEMGESPPLNQGDVGRVRWLVATDPLGSRERIEFLHSAPGIPSSTSEPVPADATNGFLNYRNTFYWNQSAMEQYSDSDPDRYLNASYVFHWLHDATGGPNNVASASIPESVQAQGERRLWFLYPGQSAGIYQGRLSTPASAARILATGEEQRLQMTYDLSGRVLSMTDPIGRSYSYRYAANGIDLLSARNDNANGGLGEVQAAFTYNPIHRPLTFTDYAGRVYTATYNSGGQLTSIARPDGLTTTLSYDARGFLLQVAIAGTSFRETYTYDDANRVRTWTSTDGYVLTFDYDSLDRLTKTTYPNGTSDVVVFDRMDAIEIRNRLGQTATYRYDPADRLTSATDSAGRTTTYLWCGCGALQQVTDPQGHTVSWLRDGLNRAVVKQVDNQTTAVYAYDVSGRPVARTDALGQTVRHAFNADNTLAAIAYQNAQHPTPGVQLLWDPTYRRPILMTDGFGTTAFTYYPAGVLGAGRLASLVAPAPDRALTFQYDAIGRKVSRTIDGVALATGYDAEGRVAAVTSPLGTFTPTYDGSSGRPLGVAYPNGQGPTFSYLDAAHDFRVAQLRYGPAAASFNLSQFDYQYDAGSDQILGLVWHDLSHQAGQFFSFAYDDAKQLTGRQETTNPALPPMTILHSIGYGYDQSGNRTSESLDGTFALATFDGANQLLGLERGLSSAARAAIRAARAHAAALRAEPKPPKPTSKVDGGVQ